MTIVDLAIDVNLSLRDVTSQIRDWVSDICTQEKLSALNLCEEQQNKTKKQVKRKEEREKKARRTIVWHGQNRELGNGAVATKHTTGTLVNL